MSARELKDKQRKAVESWGGDVCVVAGPGSGKTFVLVERFRWLVLEKNISPHRILAITFTEKAAASMRRKLIESFPAGSRHRAEVERSCISTIHGFCARLLRENAIAAEVDPEFRVLDEWEADFELRRAIDGALEQAYSAEPERARRFLAAFASDQVHESLFCLYQALRAAGASISQASRIPPSCSLQQSWAALVQAFDQTAACSTAGWNTNQRDALGDALAVRKRLAELAGLPASIAHFQALRQIDFVVTAFKRGSRQRELLTLIRDELAPRCRRALLLEANAENRQWFLETLSKADSLYRAGKQQRAMLDYADLEEYAIRLLERTGGRIAATFDHILIDEFQDTNALQSRLVSRLRQGAKLFVVGDINQSIYGFRHADPEVFRAYREQTRSGGGEVHELAENFRSRQEVLDAIKAIARDAPGIEVQELTAGTRFLTASQPCLEVLVVHAEDGDRAFHLEAQHIAARIRELCGHLTLKAGEENPGGEPQTRVAGYGDFAVLCRTSMQLRIIEQVLRDQGLPCQITEGRGFYDTREVNDLIHFLRALWNPLDEISLAAVLRSPLAGISDESLFRAKLAAGSLLGGLRHGLDDNAAAPHCKLPPDEAAKVKSFLTLFDRWRARRDYMTIDRLLAGVLADTGYFEQLLRRPGGPQKAANVSKLMALARRFHASGQAGLDEFIERAQQLRRFQVREGEAEPPDWKADAVQLMTIHAAKGLEFPVVFVPALNRSLPNDKDPVSFLPSIGIGMQWVDPATGKIEADTFAAEIFKKQDAARNEEEERLLYVAVTRAKELVALSASFGPTVQIRQWAKTLKKLGIKLPHIENRVLHAELEGIPARLLQTNQPPAAAEGKLKTSPAESGVIWCEQPDTGDQSDTAVSASAVTLFAVCPRRYYLSRYLGFEESRMSSQPLPKDDTSDSERDETDPSEFGRQVHALLAGEAAPGAGPEALRLVKNFEGSEWGRRLLRATRIEREQEFLILVGPPAKQRLLRGQMDLWFEDAGEIVLLDYKTDQASAAEVAGKAAEYALQLRLYALALEQIARKRPDRAVLYFLRPNTAAEIPVDDASLEAARAKVEELYQAQSSQIFPLHVGKHCFQCPNYRGACPAQHPEALAASQATKSK